VIYESKLELTGLLYADFDCGTEAVFVGLRSCRYRGPAPTRLAGQTSPYAAGGRPLMPNSGRSRLASRSQSLAGTKAPRLPASRPAPPLDSSCRRRLWPGVPAVPASS
jgi:hypothetical protein